MTLDAGETQMRDMKEFHKESEANTKFDSLLFSISKQVHLLILLLKTIVLKGWPDATFGTALYGRSLCCTQSQ